MAYGCEDDFPGNVAFLPATPTVIQAWALPTSRASLVAPAILPLRMAFGAPPCH